MTLTDTYAIVIPTILPERQTQLGMLLSQLAQLCPDVPIVVSPHITGMSTRSDCVRALCRGAAHNCDWTIYLEDDAFLAPVFAREVIRTLCEAKAGGFRMATFYSDAQVMVTAMLQRKQSHIIEPRHFWSSVCVAISTNDVPGLAAFASKWYCDHPQHWHASDLLLAAYCASRGSKILACVPSPVQHRDPPSTLNHRVRRRRFSRTFKAVYGEIE